MIGVIKKKKRKKAMINIRKTSVTMNEVMTLRKNTTIVK